MEISLFICATRLAFFLSCADFSVDRKLCRTTGVVCVVQKVMSRLVCPIAIFAEFVTVSSSLDIFLYAPFEPHGSVEALKGDR